MAAARTYHATVLVCSKRKLGESDLILSMLSGDGSLIEAVAKGARKPTSSFANRLDLFCESEVMLARGRSLDIASEVRLIDAHSRIRENAPATFAAAPILDCLARTALPNLPVEHLYPMSTAALRHIDTAPEAQMPSVTAAFLVKLFAVLGVRPILEHCVSCGSPFPEDGAGDVSFSYDDGGYVCKDCSSVTTQANVPYATIRWALALLGSTFDEVLALDVPLDASFGVLSFANAWLRDTQHVNSRALAQLLTCGLF